MTVAPAFDVDQANRVIGRDALDRMRRALDALTGGDLAFVTLAIAKAAIETEEIAAAAKQQETTS